MTMVQAVVVALGDVAVRRTVVKVVKAVAIQDTQAIQLQAIQVILLLMDFLHMVLACRNMEVRTYRLAGTCKLIHRVGVLIIAIPQQAKQLGHHQRLRMRAARERTIYLLAGRRRMTHRVAKLTISIDPLGPLSGHLHSRCGRRRRLQHVAKVARRQEWPKEAVV
uniref:Poly-glutamine tract-binding protein n=1 Tax=Karlodinium veneficum TaxID=407301 RepID=E8Z700_KARVE|nr:poly-glutamine tract-binding protein [Karlodinium veneficum]